MSMWKDTTTLSRLISSDEIQFPFFICCAYVVMSMNIALRTECEHYVALVSPPHTIISTSICPFTQSSEFNIDWEIWTHVQATEKSSSFLCVLCSSSFSSLFFRLHSLLLFRLLLTHIPRSHNINYQSSAIVFITNDVSAQHCELPPTNEAMTLTAKFVFVSRSMSSLLIAFYFGRVVYVC